MWELVQVTARYSHAVLLAILPFVSDFAEKLDLPITSPITTNQVLEFKCDPRLGQTGGAIILTNGYQFTFLDGRISVYRSPESYFSLQDPEQIPHFFGAVKLNQKEALKIARGAIKKLGYENSVFDAGKKPLVTLPEKVGTNFIARYRFRWLDSKWPGSKDSSIIPALLDIEINASNRKIEMMLITSRDTRRPSPKVGVTPPLLHPKAPPQKLSGGTPTAAVNSEYASAFLKAILPQASDFIIKAGLNITVPLTTNQVVATNYTCRIMDGQPIAQFYLTNGDRFFYRQGYISTFYSHDAYSKFPEEGRTEDFLGHINMTTDEAIALCEGVMRKLGYNGEFATPIVSYAPARGKLAFKRYSFYWRHTGEEVEFATFEVDMETKTVKCIYLKDPTFERPLPKIDLVPTP